MSEFVGGLPARLRAGVESLSGIAMDDVRVHRNSSEPAKLGALAFTRGTQIHLGPGQEEHLPHEAWHVVQQKQGRVQATTQMKGLALNKDSDLEREADRLGGRAEHADECRPVRWRKTAAAPVLQAKVKDGDTWLDEDKQRVSPTLRMFILKSEKYMLRADFHGRLTAEPVHLLDMSKRYLFGETHGPAADENWEQQTEDWPKVDKMFEGHKAFPQSEKEPLGIPETEDPQKRALENLHAYMMAPTLFAFNDLEFVATMKAKLSSLPLDVRVKVAQLITAPWGWLIEVLSGMNEYTKAKPSTVKTAKATETLEFVELYKKSYEPKIMDLIKTMNEGADLTISSVKESVGGSDKAKLDLLDQKFVNVQESMRSGRETLRLMALKFIEFSQIYDPGEAEKLRELANIKGTGGSKDVLGATNAARERGMAENIKRVQTPLFVKLGNAHLTGVASLVGPSVFLIPQGKALEDETSRLTMELPSKSSRSIRQQLGTARELDRSCIPPFRR